MAKEGAREDGGGGSTASPTSLERPQPRKTEERPIIPYLRGFQGYWTQVEEEFVTTCHNISTDRFIQASPAAAHES